MKKIEKQKNKKKEPEKHEKHEANETQKKKIEKEIMIIIAFMVFALAGVFFVTWLGKHVSTFSYDGMRFSLQKIGDITFYTTTLKIVRNDGVFNYTVYLRNDPRKLENIVVNANLTLKQNVIVAFDPHVDTCPNGGLAGLELGQFFDMLGIRKKVATTSQEVAASTGKMLANCSNATNKTNVILFTQGDASITQQGNCFVVNVSNCQILNSVERFIVVSLGQFIGLSKQKTEEKQGKK